MQLSPRHWLSAAALSALAVLACGDDDSPFDAAGDDADSGAQDGPPSEELGLRFQPDSTLLLSPGQEATLEVIASPPGSRVVSFGLLAADPTELRDASLDRTEATLDASGRAEVKLRATSVAATFLVRASLDEVTEARRAVSVSSLGYGSVRVSTTYEGKRRLPTWTASARVGVTCPELENPLSDGPLLTRGAAPLLIEAIPVGPDITVTVRAGQLVAGCLMIKRLAPDEVRELQVLVTDLPLHVDQGSLNVTFGIETSTPAFASELDQAIALGVAGFTQEKGNDAQVLLDTWAAGLDQEAADEFAQNRASFDFDALVLGLLDSPEQLRLVVQSHLTAAALTVVGADTFEGQLTFGPKRATFSLGTAAGVPAPQSGFFPSSSWSRAIDVGDVLVLGGSLQYLPTRWLSSIAENTNLTNNLQYPGEELASLADCQAISEALTAAVGGPIVTDCDQSCAVLACQDALERAWTRVAGASTTLSTLAVAMSGTAEHDAEATITGFTGTWLGTTSPGNAAVGGPAHGTETSE